MKAALSVGPTLSEPPGKVTQETTESLQAKVSSTTVFHGRHSAGSAEDKEDRKEDNETAIRKERRILNLA